MQIHYRFYFFSLITIHLIYGLVFLGVFSKVPQYVYIWNMAVQIFLCLFLMYRYYPFQKEYKFKPMDAKLIFGSSLLLLINIISLPVLYSNVYAQINGQIRQLLPKSLPELPSISGIKLASVGKSREDET
jgi:hypothetical protein